VDDPYSLIEGRSPSSKEKPLLPRSILQSMSGEASSYVSII
jgi:hypothetical protein